MAPDMVDKGVVMVTDRLDLFTDYEEQRKNRAEEDAALERERRVQKDVLDIKKKYGDIINLPNPTSPTHPRMSLYDRAAQFSPFAALTGHEEAIRETARLTDERMELNEDEEARLNEKLQMLRENGAADKVVTITYFKPDEKKSGGAYVTHTGRVKRIDEFERTLVLTDRTVISMEQISDLSFPD